MVPVYNTGDYLRACVDSVRGQSFKDCELILIDDGSDDGSSGALCDAIAAEDTGVRVLHQSNGGLSRARNAGLALAGGDYILFIDSDDFFSDLYFLEKLAAEIARSDPDVVCYNYARYNDDEGKKAFGAPNIRFVPEGGAASNTKAMVAANAYQSSAWSKAVRRKLLREDELGFEPGRLSEDVEYSGRLLALAGKVVYLPITVYGYRVRSDSITSAVSAEHFNDLLVAVERLANEVTPPPGREQAFYGYTAFQFCTLLINWRRAGSPEENGERARIQALDWLLAYHQYGAVRLIWLCYRVLGLNTTSRLLSFYYGKTRP